MGVWPVLWAGLLSVGNIAKPQQQPTVTTVGGAINSSSSSSDWMPRVPLRAAAECRRMDHAVVVVDVENVRGKSGFQWTHAQLLLAMQVWTTTPESSTTPLEDAEAQPLRLYGKVLLVVDHGSQASSYWNADAGYSIVFAGPHCKADDTIALDIVPFLIGATLASTTTDTDDDAAICLDEDPKKTLEHCSSIVVVTADRELIQRCKRAVSEKTNSNTNNNTVKLQILSPDLLLSDLEKIRDAHPSQFYSREEIITTIDSTVAPTTASSSGLTNDYELVLGADFLELEALLRDRSMSSSRRKKLRLKGQAQWQKLSVSSLSSSRGSSENSAPSVLLLDRIVDFLKQETNRKSIASTISSSSSDDSTANSLSLFSQLSQSEQSTLLRKWNAVMQKMKKHPSKYHKEKTGDRIVLAEKLRLDMEEQYRPFWIESSGGIPDATKGTADKVFAAKLYAVHKTGRHNSDHLIRTLAPSLFGVTMPYSEIAPQIQKPTGLLRLVVVSDTHGFEEQLTACPDSSSISSNTDEILTPPPTATLPDGDVLLHLGDFADDRGSNNTLTALSLKKFDAWLARQPHAIKIVLRGNHDPRTFDFVQSGATYVTQAKTEIIAGYKFAFAPHLSGGLRRKKFLPNSCDILISHVPPYNILDRCVTGKHAGSQTLVKGVQQMTNGPPLLWMCGHIHEGRGVVRNTVFCLNKETIVINAANANSGRAARLDYGPVVVHMGKDEKEVERIIKSSNRVEIVQMEGQYVFMNEKYSGFFHKRVSIESRQMLLAVDLGLRTGMCLFADDGRLLRYDNFQFQSADDLQQGAATVLKEWQASANADVAADKSRIILRKDTSQPAQWRITHVAVEGGDPPLANAWRQAVTDHNQHLLTNQEKGAGDESRIALLFVKPNEWRNDLLRSDELASGEASKAASRHLAQKIVADHHCHPSEAATIQSPPLSKQSRQHQQEKDEKTRQDFVFQTDMAESILLGLHVARRLGWVNPLRDPPIRRFDSMIEASVSERVSESK